MEFGIFIQAHLPKARMEADGPDAEHIALVNEVDLVKEADDGRLLKVRITMRPVQAIQAWAEAMTTRMGRPSPPHG